MKVRTKEEIIGMIQNSPINTVYVLLGMSAAGKDTIQNDIVAATGVHKLTSYTTRDMRPGETDGVEHRYVNDTTFDFLDLRINRSYIDETGRRIRFGLPTPALDGKVSLVILDVSGYEDLVRETPCEVISIKVAAPEPIRRCRAQCRGGFDEAAWERREAVDQPIAEFEADYVINNYSDEEIGALHNDACVPCNQEGEF